jgi:hypothetical protein
VIAGDGPAGSDAQVEDVEILVGEPDREYRVLAPLQARVEMKNLFSRERTVEEVNDALRKEAARLGANAVINVTYKRGMSATSWSALTANGTGVLLDPARGPAR